MTKYLFDLTIVTPSGVWRNEQAFEDDFAKYLETKGLQANKLVAKDKIAIEVIPSGTPVKNLIEKTIPREQKTEPKEEKIVPPRPPQESLTKIFADLANASKKQKKFKIFKESIL